MSSPRCAMLRCEMKWSVTDIYDLSDLFLLHFLSDRFWISLPEWPFWSYCFDRMRFLGASRVTCDDRMLCDFLKWTNICAMSCSISRKNSTSAFSLFFHDVTKLEESGENPSFETSFAHWHSRQRFAERSPRSLNDEHLDIKRRDIVPFLNKFFLLLTFFFIAERTEDIYCGEGLGLDDALFTRGINVEIDITKTGDRKTSRKRRLMRRYDDLMTFLLFA